MGCVESSEEIEINHVEVEIRNNSVGHSYATVFGKFLTTDVTLVLVEDPYIRKFHQCQNLMRLCELLVKRCPYLRTVQLLTAEDTDDNSHQRQWLEELQEDLSSKHRVNFEVQFSPTLHDRQIKLSNGWTIKIGRGLDYFKAPGGKFSLGYYDLDLRPCLATTVNIFKK